MELDYTIIVSICCSIAAYYFGLYMGKHHNKEIGGEK